MSCERTPVLVDAHDPTASPSHTLNGGVEGAGSLTANVPSHKVRIGTAVPANELQIAIVANPESLTEGVVAAAPETTTRLFRAVESEELKDVVRFGDYNIHPNSTFKRFAYNEGDIDRFIGANPNRSYTKTSVDIPTSKLQFMFRHADPGGVGRAVGIDVLETPEFCNWFYGPVTIIP
jgi:filamentous hemagglutinin